MPRGGRGHPIRPPGEGGRDRFGPGGVAFERVAVDERGTLVGDLAEGAAQRIHDDRAAEQRLADAGDDLEGLGGHDRADRRDQGGEHATVLAGDGVVWRVGVEVAVVRAALRPGDARDTAVLRHRAPHHRHTDEHCGVVGQIAGLDAVAAVDDEVVLLEELEGVGGLEPNVVHLDRYLGVDRCHPVGGGLRLAAAQIGRGVDGLPCEIARLDQVVVEDAEGSDSRCGQRRDDGAAEPARADHEHARPGELALRFRPEPGQDQAARVPLVVHTLILARLILRTTSRYPSPRYPYPRHPCPAPRRPDAPGAK